MRHWSSSDIFERNDGIDHCSERVCLEEIQLIWSDSTWCLADRWIEDEKDKTNSFQCYIWQIEVEFAFMSGSFMHNKTNDNEENWIRGSQDDQTHCSRLSIMGVRAHRIKHWGPEDSSRNRLVSIRWWIRPSSMNDHHSYLNGSWFSPPVSPENFRLCDFLHRADRRWPKNSIVVFLSVPVGMSSKHFILQ